MSKVADRNQRQLLELLKVPGNEVCADCKKKNPRWSSSNFGIFICEQCCGLHRKIGTHISKVKSLTLDTWTREQVDHMRANGNALSNSKLNPDERKNPPPISLDESERNSQMEKYIRSKYEYRLFVPSNSSISAPPPNPSNSNQDRRISTSTTSISSSISPPPSNSTLPSISKSNYDTISIASSSDSVKHVRFRAASVPIPEAPPSTSRPNSRLGGINEVKPTGILRARSATVAVTPTPNLTLSSSQYFNQAFGFSSNTTDEVIPTPIITKVPEPRFNPSIWDDIDALAGKSVPPPQPTRSYTLPNPQPSFIPTLQSPSKFIPSSQFGQQFQSPPLSATSTPSFVDNNSTSPFQHNIQQQSQFQLQPPQQQYLQPQQQFQPQQSFNQYPSSLYPTSPGIGTPTGMNYNTNPFHSSMNMAALNSTLPQLQSTNISSSISQPQYYQPQPSIQSQSTSNNPFYQNQSPSTVPVPQQQVSYTSNPNPYGQYQVSTPSLSVDNSNPFTFNQPQQQQQQQQQQQTQYGNNGYQMYGNQR